MEKVIVSKEVAEEIEYAIAEYRTIASATLYLLNEADLTDVQVDQALRGYYVGYEIEKTPEEKVAAYYEELREEFEGEAMAAVASTLNLLGIKIEGVNA